MLSEDAQPQLASPDCGVQDPDFRLSSCQFPSDSWRQKGEIVYLSVSVVDTRIPILAIAPDCWFLVVEKTHSIARSTLMYHYYAILRGCFMAW